MKTKRQLFEQKVRKLVNEVLSENPDIDTYVYKIEQLVDANHHTEAVLQVAKLLNDTKYIKILKMLIHISKLEGHVPFEITRYRYEILKQLLDSVKQKLGQKEYKRIHGVF